MQKGDAAVVIMDLVIQQLVLPRKQINSSDKCWRGGDGIIGANETETLDEGCHGDEA
jgi:hypothetical protein